MGTGCTIKYLENSGFSVRTDGLELVFDCIDGYRAPEGRRVIYFISHAHRDHFDSAIPALSAPGICEVVLGYDILSIPGCRTMRPGDSLDIFGARVEAFGSTDEGVSYLVRLPGLTLFHAGDLNDWHWRSESTPEEAQSAHEQFMSILEGIPASEIDVAFFPVDPRMGEGYSDGAHEFIAHAHPRLFIPMHWVGRPEIATEFAENSFDGTRVVALHDHTEFIYGGDIS